MPADPAPQSGGAVVTSLLGRGRPSRQRRPVVLLRPVPGTSVIHRLWAGTKLIVVFVFSVLLAFYPGWIPIALTAGAVLIAARLAHIPRGALPTIPRWLWLLLLLGMVTATLGGGDPVLQVWSAEVQIGGLLKFLRFTALSIVLLGMGAMVSWTTNVADVAPAVATLGSRPGVRSPGNRPPIHLTKGERVNHDSFGLGTVIDLRGDGDKAQAQVDFGGDTGVKWLLLRFAPLEKL